MKSTAGFVRRAILIGATAACMLVGNAGLAHASTGAAVRSDTTASASTETAAIAQAATIPAATAVASNVRRGFYLTLTGCRIAGWAGIVVFRWTVFTCAPEILAGVWWYRLYTDR